LLNIWIGTNKTENGFTNGYLTLTASYIWNTVNNTWKGYSKNEYAYDANGFQILNATYTWSNQWVGSSKSTNVFDNLGNQLLYISYTWDTLTNDWIGSQKYVYAYNSDNLQTEAAYYFWDINTNSWIGSSKQVYNYNSSGDIITDITYGWDTENVNWGISSIGTYYYASRVITSLTNQNTNDLVIYPNPVTSGFILKGFSGSISLSIYNLTGKLMITKVVNGQEQISLSTLPTGIYVVKLITVDRIIEKKLVKN